MLNRTSERADVYTRVTNQIIKAIENGVSDNWQMPWHCVDGLFQYPVNIETGKRYRGVNVLSLWVEAHVHGYPESVWGTMRQWNCRGLRVHKGEKAAIGVLWKTVNAPATNDDLYVDTNDESGRPRQRLVAKSFPLFNAAQIEGYRPLPDKPLPPEPQRISCAEEFFGALEADIRHGGNRAYYNLVTDHIQIPTFDAFVDPLAYYSTLAHEAVHWSGHPARLSRDLAGRFGSESYSSEELIAEIGSAFIAADLGLSLDPRPENIAYIDNWLRVLRADNRAIFAAASYAQRAVDYMQDMQLSASPVSSPSMHSLTL